VQLVQARAHKEQAGAEHELTEAINDVRRGNQFAVPLLVEDDCRGIGNNAMRMRDDESVALGVRGEELKHARGVER
jgi:hypothetical protein